MGLTYEQRKELFLKNLKEKKNDEYELLGEFTKVRDKTKFRHKICGHEWETIPYTLLKSKSTGCPNCQYKEKSKTTEEFINEVEEHTKGEYQLIEGQEYINNRHKLLFRHITCNTEFKLRPYSIFVNTISCPTCAKKQRQGRRGKTTEEFKKELYKLRGSDFELVGEYKQAFEKVSIKHVICGNTFFTRPYHALHDRHCPYSSSSLGEGIVRDYLEKNNIPYKQEYTFDDCLYVNKLRFDFAIIDGDHLQLIEYDGEQHYKPIDYFGGQETFNKQRQRDKVKNDYCKDKGISLLRIPYYLNKKEIEHELDKFICM